MYKMTDEEFEGAVQDAIDSIPDEFLEELENVVFLVEDEPSDEQLAAFDDEEDIDDGMELDGLFSEDGDLLGLYDGISLLDRADGYGYGGDYPDTITIFKGPHERVARSREGLFEEVRKTVVHEIAHYFGLDEDEVAEMGYA